MVPNSRTPCVSAPLRLCVGSTALFRLIDNKYGEGGKGGESKAEGSMMNAEGTRQLFPRSAEYRRVRPKPNPYVQPSIFDMLADASPASAMDGCSET